MGGGEEYETREGLERESESAAGSGVGEAGAPSLPPVAPEPVGATRERIVVDPFAMPGLDPQTDAS